MDQPTNGQIDEWTDGRPDTPSYREGGTHLKSGKGKWRKRIVRVISTDRVFQDTLFNLHVLENKKILRNLRLRRQEPEDYMGIISPISAQVVGNCLPAIPPRVESAKNRRLLVIVM